MSGNPLDTYTLECISLQDEHFLQNEHKGHFFEQIKVTLLIINLFKYTLSIQVGARFKWRLV